MQVVHTKEELAEKIAEWRHNGDHVALVPTMGNIHAGHVALVELAREHAERVVVSIFVNPTQFGEGEDFDSYPRTLERDTRHLKKSPADLIFAHLLAKRTPANHYAPERDTRYFSFKRIRSGMLAASILLLVGSLGWSAYKFIEYVEARQDTLRVKRETIFYTKLLNDARDNLPPAPALAHEVKAAVEMADTLRD